MSNGKSTNKKKGKNKFYFDGSMMAAVIFFLFCIPVSNILGSDGNGYLAVTWELYVFLNVFLGGNLGNAIVHMVKPRMKKQRYHNITGVLTVSLITGILISLIGAAGIWFLADMLCGNMLGARLSSVSFRWTGLLLVSSVSVSVFRGYFEGIGGKVPAYCSKVIEVLVSGTAACIFSNVLAGYGEKTGALLFNAQYVPAFKALGVIAGCIIGSLAALIFLIVVNMLYQAPLGELYKKDETKVPEPIFSVIKELVSMSVKTLLPVIFFKLYRLADIGVYLKNNMSEEGSVTKIQQIGFYHGRVLILLGLVCVIILAFSCKNIRKINHFYKKNRPDICKKSLKEDVKHILLGAVPGMAVLLIAGKSIFQLFFKTASQTELKMLQIGCIGVIIVPLCIYLYRVLKTIGQEIVLTVISAVGFVFQMIVMTMLVKTENMAGMAMITAEISFWAVVLGLEAVVVLGCLKKGKISSAD